MRGVIAPVVLAFVIAGCSGGGSEGEIASEPTEKCMSRFRNDFYKDFSDSPMINTVGCYTPALLAKLEDCGAGREEYRRIRRAVEDAGPSSATSPEVIAFTTLGDPPRFAFRLEEAAALTYELVGCEKA